jgi:cytochrome b6-f complex iron-sulfur subunit
MRRVRRHLERLLRQRRPRPFVPTDDEAAAIRAAITLRAARPEDALPDPEFVTQLHGRLAELARRAGEPEPEPGGREPSRRRGLVLGAAAAVSAAIAVTADRTLVAGDRPDPGAGGPAPTLEPNHGDWHTVMTSADLAPGAVTPFDAGTISGFLIRTAEELTARSGVCTHQGCRLAFERQDRRLACPCHRTFFALDGEVIVSQLRTPPARLPSIRVRERDGVVQVFVPRI